MAYQGDVRWHTDPESRSFPDLTLIDQADEGAIGAPLMGEAVTLGVYEAQTSRQYVQHHLAEQGDGAEIASREA